MHRSTQDSRTISMPTDLRAVYYLLVGKAWLIAAITAAAILAGVGYAARSEKIYSATTTIQVEEEQQKLIKSDGRRPDGQTGEALKTIEQNLQSPALMLRLAHHGELAHDPAFLRHVEPSAPEERLQKLLSGKISVEIRRGTRLIDVTVEDASPALAQKIANLLVGEFTRANSESSAQVSRGAHEFLRHEADRLKETLAKSEQSLQRSKERYQTVSLDEKRNLIAERLKDLNQKISSAKAERLKLDADRAQIQQWAGEPTARLLALPSVAGSAEVADAQKKIGEKTAEIALLSLRYKPEHPKYIEAASTLADLQATRDQAIIKAAGLVETAVQAADATGKQLEDALHGQEALALELSQMAIPYNALAREVESDRALYEALVTRLKETDVAQGVSPYAIRTIAPALLPDRPIRPNKRAILLLSVCGGLALGLTCALGRHMLDTSLSTVDEAERALGLSVIGAIPQQRGLRPEESRRLLIEKPHSAIAEAFRALRTALPGTGKTVLFASAIPGEGKSFCAIQCAVALARQGLRTLLIDADLRRPTIGPIVLAKNGAHGVTEILRGQCDFDAAVQSTDIESLSVLPAGASVADPAELVGKSNLADFIRLAQTRFDRVVIDTAPVLAVSETVVFVRHADAVCLVVGAGRTPAPAAARALQKLRASGANVAGVVLNRLPTRGNYYYHYQAPGYGRDETYGASPAAHRD